MANVLAMPQIRRGNDHSEWLPTIVRIVNVTRSTNERGLVDNRALVVGGQFQATLIWTSQHADTRLQKGSLVRVEWPEHLSDKDEMIKVTRLVFLDAVDHGVNLFETIPNSWIRDQALLDRAKTLWETLSAPFQACFNELFWDSGRFQRFLFVPGSLNGHHNSWHGNFEHAVEVAENARRVSANMPGVSQSVLILAALIHDAGKADEYSWSGNYWRRTDAGSLIGHKDILKAWLGAIFDRKCDLLTEAQRHGLWHTLFSAKNAPAYLDIRESCMLEAEILSMADRLSGSQNLHQQVGHRSSGFGARHEHLRARPYRLPDQC